MPNWCNNTIKVQATKERIDEFEKFLNENDGKEWFTYFRPLPEELINEGWYEWSINNWGCKWNCDANDWQRIDDVKSIRDMFVTAVFTDGYPVDLIGIDAAGRCNCEVVPEVAVIGAIGYTQVNATAGVGYNKHCGVEVVDDGVNDDHKGECGDAGRRKVVVGGSNGDIISAH